MVEKREIYQYSYCPEKHKLQYRENVDVPPTKEMVLGVLLHTTREILEREEYSILKGIEKGFSFNDILKEYKKKKEEIFEYSVKKKASLVHNLSDEELDFAREDLELLLHEKAIKTKRILSSYNVEKDNLAEFLCPPWKYVRYEMRSRKMKLRGTVDLIEHFGSFFYPVEVKTGKPPEGSVFKPDRLEVGCSTLLMEAHFKIPVPVGFVEYTRIWERRPVRIDEKLKETVLRVRDLILKEKYPEKEQTGKCAVCEYRGVCWDDSDN